MLPIQCKCINEKATNNVQISKLCLDITIAGSKLLYLLVYYSVSNIAVFPRIVIFLETSVIDFRHNLCVVVFGIM